MSNNDTPYKSLFTLEEQDLEDVHEAIHQLDGQQQSFYLAFYQWMKTHPIFREDYTTEVLEAIEENEDIFWQDFLLGDFEEEHTERQKFFALIFADVGIPYDAYLAFMHYYYQLIWEYLTKANLVSLKLSLSFHKIKELSIAILTDGYNMATKQILEEQNEALKALSTPVAKLWEGILLLPLVGYMDSNRAMEVMQVMLERIGTTQAKVFILDINGISVMDTAVANHLIKITKASKLMGCTCLISGISPSIAQTIIELGVVIDEIKTTGNMLEALKEALHLTGNKVVPHNNV